MISYEDNLLLANRGVSDLVLARQGGETLQQIKRKFTML